MGFPTVKSNPWAKGSKRPANRSLWPDSFWKKLCEASGWYVWKRLLVRYHADLADARISRDLSPHCQEMIADINERMYGKR